MLKFPDPHSRTFVLARQDAVRALGLPAALKLPNNLTLSAWYRTTTVDSSNMANGSEIVSLGDNVVLRVRAGPVGVWQARWPRRQRVPEVLRRHRRPSGRQVAPPRRGHRVVGDEDLLRRRPGLQQRHRRRHPVRGGERPVGGPARDPLRATTSTATSTICASMAGPCPPARSRRWPPAGSEPSSTEHDIAGPPGAGARSAASE